MRLWSHESASSSKLLELRQVKKLLACGLLLIIVLICEWNGSRLVEIKTPRGAVLIPSRDKRRIESFLRDFIVYNSGGYTLLGEKPVSFDCFTQPTFRWNLLHLWNAYFPTNWRKYQAWKTFQKYPDLIGCENFVFWEEPSPWVDCVRLVVLANQQALNRVLGENERDFPPISMEELRTKCLLKDILKADEGLIGTVLGYGRNNAWVFKENRSALPKKSLFSTEIDHLFENKFAVLNFTFGWPQVPMAEILMYPTFIANPDTPETEKLRNEYLETRTKILKYYEGKDFLSATLELFVD
jgi:hypothetical protein